jgi:hypothetical protein
VTTSNQQGIMDDPDIQRISKGTSNQAAPGEQMPFPKVESNCHGAPVYKLYDVQRKYVCTECNGFCIPRSKK